ncbi:DMT family transporter [Pseudomonas sp. NW5]|uniref:DMT family transporter n=1 Tax=Pseudomonas sp. NW5 TaxID=2934934 RepID=UPI0020219A4C|nr:DMT family transporter [Pseudomonas sp. NW5]MCL7461536.1 DMT family transporter [Pseudomonas sp. NW5]
MKTPACGAGVWLAVSLSLLAFAGNSLLCRLALMQGAMDAHSFTVLRLLSGAVLLWLLVQRRSAASGVPAPRLGGSGWGALALFSYAYLFSVAYLQLEAGAGALLLFAAVQVSMFVGGWLRGEPLHRRVLGGMLLAFAGLLALLLPGSETPPLGSALLMLASGVAWGLYSLLGKRSRDPLQDTAGNFVRSVPLLLLPLLVVVLTGELRLTLLGTVYALASGLLASGAGYALWYWVLRQIGAQQAATVQLAVPLIAALAAVPLLGEPLGWRLLLAAALIVGGISLALRPATAPRRSADGGR